MSTTIATGAWLGAYPALSVIAILDATRRGEGGARDKERK